MDYGAVQDELAAFGDLCAADPEGLVGEMPGPKGYIHNWIYVGGPGLPKPGTRDAPQSRPPRTGGQSPGVQNRIRDLQRQQLHEWSNQPGTPNELALRQLYRSGALFGVGSDGGLTQQDREAMLQYVNSPAINRGLRRGIIPGSPRWNRMSGDADIQALDAAVHRNRLQMDVQVFRGMTSGLNEQLQTGDEIHDAGYMSTSLDPGAARRFGARLLAITVPKGTPAGHNPDLRYGMEQEKEVLLPRNAVLRVTKIEPDPSSPRDTIVYVELAGFEERTVEEA